jgi:hypothetical protein
VGFKKKRVICTFVPSYAQKYEGLTRFLLGEVYLARLGKWGNRST